MDGVYKSFMRIFNSARMLEDCKGPALYYYASLHAYMNVGMQHFFNDPFIAELCSVNMQCISNPLERHKLTALLLFKYYDYSYLMNYFYTVMSRDIEIQRLPESEKLVFEWSDPESGKTHIVIKTFCQWDECMKINHNRRMSHDFDERYRDLKYRDRAVLWTEAFFRPYYLENGGTGVDIGCADVPLLAAADQIDLEYGKNMLDMSSYSRDGYDWVHCSQAMEHIEKRQAKNLIVELKNKINPGGYLFLSTPSPSCYESNCDLQSELNPFHLWQPSIDQIFEMIRRSGGYEYVDYQNGYPFYDAFVFRRVQG
jgi:hypothetical protein